MAYEAGLAYCGESDKTPKAALDRLATLLSKTGIHLKDARVLDIGCGDGTEGIFLGTLGCRCAGIDISTAAIERARQRATEAGIAVDFLVGNAMDLGEFPPEEFDLVLDSYWLPYVRDR